MLEVLYATVLEPDMLEGLVDVPPERVRLIEKNGSSRTLAELAPAAPVSASETTIRLNVTLLDSMMTLAGELVLSRNQLNESLSRHDARGIRSGAQWVSLVTSELQEVVTLTRMQPVGSLFGKFLRLVRDLARDLGKDVQLKLDGGDVRMAVTERPGKCSAADSGGVEGAKRERNGRWRRADTS